MDKSILEKITDLNDVMSREMPIEDAVEAMIKVLSMSPKQLKEIAEQTTYKEGDVQTVVSEVVSTSELYIDDVPCLEFILHNKEEDLLYARVWNTLLEKWDETLENELNEKERANWKEKYL